MKNTRHSIVSSALLAALLSIPLYGMSANLKGEKSTPETPVAAPVTAEIVAVAPAIIPSGISTDTITLGASIALTGDGAGVGNQIVNGANLYFDKVNTQGGINGRKVIYKPLDDHYEKKLAKANVEKQLSEGVFAFFGNLGTGNALVAKPALESAKVPLFAPISGAEALRKDNSRYLWHVRASYINELDKIVDVLVSNGVTNIAIMGQNDGFGKSGIDAVTKSLALRGMKLSAVGFSELNSADATVAAREISQKKPKAVILMALAPAASSFINEYKKLGVKTQFVTIASVGAKDLSKAIGQYGSGLEISQVVPFPWSSTIPVVKEYQDAMKNKGFSEKDYDFVSLEYFISAKVMTEALRRTGRELTREKFIDTLSAMDSYDAGGFIVNYSQGNHNASSAVNITMIGRNGGFIR
jgi:branched-chain amino acid transport system substrate-binding protein